MFPTAVIVFAVNVFSSIVKKWVAPKFGDIGVQVLVFVLALAGALIATYQGAFPGLKTLVVSSLQIFSMAVAFYEVILSKIPVFKGTD